MNSHQTPKKNIHVVENKLTRKRISYTLQHNTLHKKKSNGIKTVLCDAFLSSTKNIIPNYANKY